MVPISSVLLQAAKASKKYFCAACKVSCRVASEPRRHEGNGVGTLSALGRDHKNERYMIDSDVSDYCVSNAPLRWPCRCLSRHSFKAYTSKLDRIYIDTRVITYSARLFVCSPTCPVALRDSMEHITVLQKAHSHLKLSSLPFLPNNNGIIKIQVHVQPPILFPLYRDNHEEKPKKQI